jgi:hypothetical protein
LRGRGVEEEVGSIEVRGKKKSEVETRVFVIKGDPDVVSLKNFFWCGYRRKAVK